MAAFRSQAAFREELGIAAIRTRLALVTAANRQDKALMIATAVTLIDYGTLLEESGGRDHAPSYRPFGGTREQIPE